MDSKNNLFFPNSNIKEKIASKIYKNHIPIHTTLTITNKCNFKCLHCYMEPLKKLSPSLTLDQWISILNELKSNGCISLTITGGEPLHSKIFIDLYKYAFDNNFKITVMSNLSLINNEILTLFENRPPFEIIGTLYGSTNITYEKFCSYKNGWDIVKNNISNLMELNVNLKLHTVLNTYNIYELNEMVNYTKQKNIKFHAYRKLACDTDGNIETKKYQIDCEQINYSYQILNDYTEANYILHNNKSIWSNGYKKCCAGLSACYINSSGEMHLCNHYIDFKYSILNLGFTYCWNEIYNLRKRIIEVINECSLCHNNIYCGKCNPIFMKEKKSYGFPFLECKEKMKELNYDKE